MEVGGCIEETIRGSHPTTVYFKVKNAQIEVLHKCRQLYYGAIHDVSQKEIVRPNASQLYLNNFLEEDLYIVIQLHVAIKDRETNELWKCNMKNENGKLSAVGGNFFIRNDLEFNVLARYTSRDCKGKQLPDYAGNIVCKLPIKINDDPIEYQIRIRLFQKIGTENNMLDTLQFTVLSHEYGHDLFDYQEGRSITEVERPQMKIKMTGILEKAVGRSIIMHFQNLGDNGQYKLFEEDKKKLLARIDGNADLRDLELAVMLEESILQFGQNKMDECKKTAKKARELALEIYSANAPFLMAKVHYIISAVYRQAGDFEKAREHMEKSTELLESVFVCEETAVNHYNWAALLSEMAAKTSITSNERKKAQFHFQNCLSQWRHQNQNSTDRCPMRTQIRSISFNLKTSRNEFPDLRKPVSEEDMARAAQAIDDVTRNLFKNSSKRHKVTFLIGKSDFHLRRATIAGSVYTAEGRRIDAETAVQILRSALETAEELELQQEIQGIQDRLTNIARLQENNLFNHRAERDALTLATASKVPVERDTNFIDDLLDQLPGKCPPELTRD